MIDIVGKTHRHHDVLIPGLRDTSWVKPCVQTHN